MGRGIMPVLTAMLDSGGRYAVGTAEMPSVTNVNNLSIVTARRRAFTGFPETRAAQNAVT